MYEERWRGGRVTRNVAPLKAYVIAVDGNLVRLGYYTASIALGSPPLTFSLVVDTGSTMTILPPDACEASRSATMLMRNDDWCPAEKGGPEDEICSFRIAYVEGSSYSGVIAKDVAHFVSADARSWDNATHTSDVRFGCATRGEGKVQLQVADGVLGLGKGANRMGLVQQLSLTDDIDTKAFSLCLPSLVEHVGSLAAERGGSGGVLILGSAEFITGAPSARSNMKYTPMLSGPDLNPGLFYMGLDSIEFVTVFPEGAAEGEFVIGIPMVDATRADGTDRTARTIVDSGSSYTYFGTSAFNAAVDAIINVNCIQKINARADGLRCRPIDGPDEAYRDYCFVIEGANGNAEEYDVDSIFPKMRMVFSGAGEVDDSDRRYLERVEGVATNYLFRHNLERNAWCLGIFERESIAAGASDAVIGGIFLRNMLVHFDESKSQIGFRHEDCSALASAIRRGHAAFVDAPPVPTPPPWSSKFATVMLIFIAMGAVVVAMVRMKRLLHFGLCVLASSRGSRRAAPRRMLAEYSPTP